MSVTPLLSPHAEGFLHSITPPEPDALRTIESLFIGGASLPLLLSKVLADCALAVAESGEKGDKAKVTLTLELTPGRGPMALSCTHTVAFAHPTVHGRKSEESRGHADVFVSKRGAVTLAPDAQANLDLQA